MVLRVLNKVMYVYMYVWYNYNRVGGIYESNRIEQIPSYCANEKWHTKHLCILI
jgi:hypothetical protein